MENDDSNESFCLQCGNPILAMVATCPHCGGTDLEFARETLRVRRIDVGHDNLTVHQARVVLDKEIATSVKNLDDFLVIVHGHGSSGTGGKIKVMVHDYARSLMASKALKDFIKGEDLTRTSASSRRVSSNYPPIKLLNEWNRRNSGLSIFIF